MPIITFKEACWLTLTSCKDGYAKAYAEAGLGLTAPDEIRTQCLYILNNIAHWRGDTAKLCRETFKREAK